jgi:Tol biopolymer transport system component
MSTVSDSIPLQSARSQIARHPASSLRFDWIAALISSWLVGGLYLDGWAHNHGRVDDTFFTPWHAVLYSGAAAMIAFLALNQWRNVNKGYAWRWALPKGYMLSLVGAVLFVMGGGLDLIWHTLFGVEVNIETLLSPTHLLLASAGILMITGPIRSAWSQYASGARLGWSHIGATVLCAALLLSVLTFFTNFANLITRAEDVFATPSEIDTAWYSALYTMNADGTGQTRVTYQPGFSAWSGDWSPDGTQVVASLTDISTYTSDVSSSALYIMDADGGNTRQLTDLDGSEYVPSWSPDGTKIAFISQPEGRQQIIYTINVDGSDPTALTDAESQAYMPVWSPDSQQILFTSNRSGTDYLYVMDADGGNVREVVNQGLYNWGARWSPDGEQIVFHSVRDDNTDLYTIRADGTGETRLTTDETVEMTPSWSPDGGSILFTSTRDGLTNIYQINADGSGLVNLSDNPTLVNQFPVWSPDGGKILYSASAYSSSGGSSSYNRESIGVSSVLIQTALMAGIVIVLVNRWPLPFGSLTLILGLNAALMAVLNDQYAFILPALAAGLVADVLLRTLKPTVRPGLAYYGFAFAFPLVYFALFFLAVELTYGISWTVHLWLGAIVIAAVIGLVIAFLLRLSESWTEQQPATT